MSQNLTEAAFRDNTQTGASTASADSTWVVMKFGGSALDTAENWSTVSGLLSARLQNGLRPLVVLSAMKGVTTLMEELVDIADRRLPQEELSALRKQHLDFAAKLGLDAEQVLGNILTDLENQLHDAANSKAVSLAQKAAIVSYGELLASAIAMAYLEDSGFNVLHADARDILLSSDYQGAGTARAYLSAVCDFGPDSALDQRLSARGDIVLTEGYIATNRHGETVLLGRDGSDTTAAYLAARLQARRLEVWTNVPGMFSADPGLVPSARLLKDLSYDEAQELSSTGSRILHPRCIAPLRADGIPLFIRSTASPDLAGTAVSAATTSVKPQIKGISVRTGVTLVSMEGPSMWQEAGFLARAFSVFVDHGVSVDLVSTSESSVVVSIDSDDGMLTEADMADLVSDLAKLCTVRLIEDCAVLSIIGRRIRAAISSLAPAFAIFEEEKIHMISQAANDLNFSLVIDAEVLPKILNKFHAAVIGEGGGDDIFGPGWDSLTGGTPATVEHNTHWWRDKRPELLRLAEQHSCAYVYDADSVRASAQAVTGMSSIDNCLYAMKANFNSELLQILASEGVNFDCVSPAEVEHLRRSVPGIADHRILLTLNFAPREEYEWAIREKLQITLDNIYPLQAWPELFKGQELFVRIDTGKGRGHHDHVKTAGVQSKFGIPAGEVEELVELLGAADATVIGIHSHSGSGILDPDNWKEVAEFLAEVAANFPDVRILDLGGGLGVPEKLGDGNFDIAALDKLLSAFRLAHPEFSLWLEPGRYLVATAGVLLARVTQTKGKGELRYVGVSTGMNSLIRPALYGAYHEIINLTRIDEPATIIANVVGPICESGDKLGTDRLLPECTEGDVMLIANAGAYSYVMGSRYNLREVASEFVLAESDPAEGSKTEN